jgi:hypothetical protein
MNESEVTQMLRDAIDQDPKGRVWHVNTKHLVAFAQMVADKTKRELESSPEEFDNWCKESDDGADDGGVKCKTHPDAPHGFARNASHNAGRYVCECEHWKENESEPYKDSESAKALYETWNNQPGYVQWQDGGNSHMQDKAREMTSKVALAVATEFGIDIEKGEWVGLTDEEVFAIAKELGLKCSLGGNPNIDIDYARAIEQLLKRKNT